MTDPSRPEGSPPDSPEPIATPDPSSLPEAGTSTEAEGARPARPFGLRTFTIEGRRAPALFVVGWLATFVGGGIAGLTLLGIQVAE